MVSYSACFIVLFMHIVLIFKIKRVKCSHCFLEYNNKMFTHFQKTLLFKGASSLATAVQVKKKICKNG